MMLIYNPFRVIFSSLICAGLFAYMTDFAWQRSDPPIVVNIFAALALLNAWVGLRMTCRIAVVLWRTFVR
jgi:hypothetical protein